MSAMSYVDITM